MVVRRTVYICLILIVVMAHLSESANYWMVNRMHSRPGSSRARYRHYQKRTYEGDDALAAYTDEQIEIAKTALINTILNLYGRRQERAYDMDEQ